MGLMGRVRALPTVQAFRDLNAVRWAEHRATYLFSPIERPIVPDNPFSDLPMRVGPVVGGNILRPPAGSGRWDRPADTHTLPMEADRA